MFIYSEFGISTEFGGVIYFRTWHEGVGVSVDCCCCVGFPDGAATPSLRQCHRWFLFSRATVLLLIYHQESPSQSIFLPFPPGRCEQPRETPEHHGG